MEHFPTSFVLVPRRVSPLNKIWRVWETKGDTRKRTNYALKLNYLVYKDMIAQVLIELLKLAISKAGIKADIGVQINTIPGIARLMSPKIRLYRGRHLVATLNVEDLTSS
jgi:hypothetical protein